MNVLLYGDKGLVDRHFDMLQKVKDKPNLYKVYDNEKIPTNIKFDYIVSDKKLNLDNVQTFIIDSTLQTALSYYYLTLQQKDWKDITSIEFLELSVSDIKQKCLNILYDKLKLNSNSKHLSFNLTNGYASTILSIVKEFDFEENVAIFRDKKTLNDKKFNFKKLTKIIVDEKLDFNHRAMEMLDISSLLITPNYVDTEIKNIVFPHTLFEKPINTSTQMNAFKKADYIFIPTKYEMKKMLYLINNHKNLLNKDLCLIAGGYPKLDKLRQDLTTNQQTIDSICFAPTLLEHNPEFKDSLTLLNGKEIIKYLLQNFPKYNIIFRPHPSVRRFKHTGYDITMEIVNLFKDNPRFIYDESIYYIDTFKRSEIMISDYSSSMITFALATQRPFISLNNCNLDEEYKKVYGDLSLDIRKDIGFVVYEMDKIKEKIEQYLLNKEYYKNKIITFNKNNIYNLDNSINYFKENLKYIENDIHNENWIYIKKEII